MYANQAESISYVNLIYIQHKKKWHFILSKNSLKNFNSVIYSINGH